MKKLIKPSGAPNVFLSYLIPLVIIGLTIADFVPDQKIDKILLGMLLIFGLGALGWKLDDIVGRDGASSISQQALADNPTPSNPNDDTNVTDDNTKPG